MTDIMQLRYPKVPREKLRSKIEVIYKNNIRKEQLTLNDTYRNKVYRSDTLSFLEFCEKKKPLLAGNGVLMDKNERNPAVNMLHKFGKRRKGFKKEMLSFDELSFEFAMGDLKQKNEKVKMNAW